MHIAGLQGLTLLDYPGRLACTVFTAGCNLRCPFCHNGTLLSGSQWAAAWEDKLFALLEKRRGVLEGVCVTGGEPLLQDDLPALLRRIRALGYRVKLDTNGCFPARLAALMEEGLVDYVAMDLKNAPARYAETCGVAELDLTPVRESARLLLEGAVDYEFRTTLVRGLHRPEDGAAAAQLIPGARRWFLQRFVPPAEPLCPGLEPLSKEEMEAFAQAARPTVGTVALRGV